VRVDLGQGGVHLLPMPRHALLVLLLVAGAAPVVHAQAEYHVRLGAVGGGKLLRDAIVSEITVKQSLAPMLALGGSLPIGVKGFRANLEATFSSGHFHRDEGGSSFALGTLRTGSLLAGLEGPIRDRLRWRAGVGVIRYFPSEHEGIFLSGGTTRLLAGAGLDYRYPVHATWDLMASAHYDYHRFQTGTLEDRGFGQPQGVSRVALSVGLSRGLR
jgi:hypothetical protein